MNKKIFYIISLLFLFGSCYQDFNLGVDILPPDDFINMEVIDTVTIKSVTVESEPIRTDNPQTLLIGRYIDPYFGETEASFAVQMFLIDYPGFPEDIVLDSVCMVLPLKMDEEDYYYGNPFEPMKVKVYRVTDSLNTTQARYSTDTLNLADYELIGDNYAYFNPADSAITIRLFDSWGQYLIDNQEDIFYAYSTYFHEIIKGFYFLPYEGDAAIFKLDINKDRYTTKFKMLMYYHSESNPDTQYVFDGVQANQVSARFNLYKHNYEGTPVETQLQNPDGIYQQVYLQGLGGTKIKISFPYIENLYPENIIVNKAELVIKVDQNSIGRLLPIKEVTMMAKDTAGNEVFFEDLIEPVSNSYYGAELQNYSEYRLNITRIVQSLIKGIYSDLNIYIVDKTSSIDFKRSVINTSYASDNPMKLVIFYTKY